MPEETNWGENIRVTRAAFTYLKPDDPQAHLDFPPLQPAPENRAHCRECGGHGGWNLRLNAHQLPPGRDDTPENRHRFRHYQAACSNCNGWGHVPLEQAEHVHRWETLSWENQQHWECCRDCGQEKITDTSG